MANVKVAVRVRPPNPRESVDGGRLTVQVEDKFIKVRNLKLDSRTEGLADSREKLMEFSFDYCYWSVDPSDHHFASQEEVFQDLGVSVLSGASEGYNVCLFAYGQTGSGKTYTMMGTPDSAGLTPRICQGLFDGEEAFLDTQNSSRVEISFLEIYNERVRDLLRGGEQKSRPSLRVREHPDKGPYVQDLSQHAISDYKQAMDLLEEGISNRITAATHNHDASSRSHAIFTIQYTQAILEHNLPSETVSKINLVDLAGSERADPNYSRDRLTEGSNINKSLVTLGIVISALAQNSQMSSSCQSINSVASEGDGSTVGSHSSSLSGSGGAGGRRCFIPYRDSVLTWLLKDSLGGNSKTIMIATVSPSANCYSETLSTLRYAAHARNIVNKPRVNEDPNVRLIRELREEVDRLKSMLLSFEMQRNISPSLSDERDGSLSEIVLQNELKVEQLTKDWSEGWRDQQEMLKQHGVDIDKDRAGFLISSLQPHLVALDRDVLSTGVVFYHLKEGVTYIGQQDQLEKPQIVLQGRASCEIENHGGVVTLRPLPGCVCLLNDREVTEPCRLAQGSVITLGGVHKFRFNHPTEAAVLRERRRVIEGGAYIDLSALVSDNGELKLEHQLGASLTPAEEPAARRRLEEQKRYVESLREEIQAEQRRAEKELEREQANLQQQHTEIQLWVLQEECRLSASEQRITQECGVQADLLPAPLLEKLMANVSKSQEDLRVEYPPVTVRARKKTVQEELLKHHALRRTQSRIRRKKLQYQLRKICNKRHLLEAKRELQQLEKRLPLEPDSPESPEVDSPAKLRDWRLLSSRRHSFSADLLSRLYPQNTPIFRHFLKRNKSAERSLNSSTASEPIGSRTWISDECLPRERAQSCSGSLFHEQNQPSLHESCFVNNVEQIPRVKFQFQPLLRQPERKPLLPNRDLSFKNQPKDKNTALALASPLTNKENVHVSTADSFLNMAISKEDGNIQQEVSSKSSSSLVAPRIKMALSTVFGRSSSCSKGGRALRPFGRMASKFLRRQRAQKSLKDAKANKSSSSIIEAAVSCENLDQSSLLESIGQKQRRWHSTESLTNRTSGWIDKQQSLFGWIKEDEEFGGAASDCESLFSLDSLSSAHAAALAEQLRHEEANLSGAESEDSEMSKDSLMVHKRKEPSGAPGFGQFVAPPLPQMKRSLSFTQNSRTAEYSLNLDFSQADNRWSQHDILEAKETYRVEKPQSSLVGDFKSTDAFHKLIEGFGNIRMSLTARPEPVNIAAATKNPSFDSEAKTQDIYSNSLISKQEVVLTNVKSSPVITSPVQVQAVQTSMVALALGTSRDVSETDLRSFSVGTTASPDVHQAGHVTPSLHRIAPETPETARSLSSCRSPVCFSANVVNSREGGEEREKENESLEFLSAKEKAPLFKEDVSRDERHSYRDTRNMLNSLEGSKYRELLGTPGLEVITSPFKVSRKRNKDQEDTFKGHLKVSKRSDSEELIFVPGSQDTEDLCCVDKSQSDESKEEQCAAEVNVYGLDSDHGCEPGRRDHVDFVRFPISDSVKSRAKAHSRVSGSVPENQKDSSQKGATVGNKEDIAKGNKEAKGAEYHKADAEEHQEIPKHLCKSDEICSAIDLRISKIGKDPKEVRRTGRDDDKRSDIESLSGLSSCLHGNPDSTENTPKDERNEHEKAVIENDSVESVNEGSVMTAEAVQSNHRGCRHLSSHPDGFNTASRCKNKMDRSDLTQKMGDVHPQIVDICYMDFLSQRNPDSVETACEKSPKLCKLPLTTTYSNSRKSADLPNATLGTTAQTAKSPQHSQKTIKYSESSIGTNPVQELFTEGGLHKCNSSGHSLSTPVVQKSDDRNDRVSDKSQDRPGCAAKELRNTRECPNMFESRYIFDKFTETNSNSPLFQNNYSAIKGLPQDKDKTHLSGSGCVMSKQDKISPTKSENSPLPSKVNKCTCSKKSSFKTSQSSTSDSSLKSSDEDKEDKRAIRKCHSRLISKSPRLNGDKTAKHGLGHKRRSRGELSKSNTGIGARSCGEEEDELILPSSTALPNTNAKKCLDDGKSEEERRSESRRSGKSQDSLIHFASSDINPFVHMRQSSHSDHHCCKNPAFGSAADLSCKSPPLNSSVRRITRCCSVDNGLNGQDSPFTSHLSAYAADKGLSSTLSSMEDYKDKASLSASPRRNHSAELCSCLSSQAVNSSSSGNDAHSLGNTSSQVDEIMFVYSSEAIRTPGGKTQTCELGTQTEVSRSGGTLKRKDRHKRSSTDILSSRKEKESLTWASMENMSAQLSKLIDSTSDLLEDVQGLRKGEVLKSRSSTGSTTPHGKAADFTNRNCSTQTSLDVSIQTEEPSSIAQFKAASDIRGEANKSHEINVIVKVIGSDVSATQEWSRICEVRSGEKKQRARDLRCAASQPQTNPDKFSSARTPEGHPKCGQSVSCGVSKHEAPAASETNLRSSRRSHEEKHTPPLTNHISTSAKKRVIYTDRASSPILTVATKLGLSRDRKKSMAPHHPAKYKRSNAIRPLSSDMSDTSLPRQETYDCEDSSKRKTASFVSSAELGGCCSVLLSSLDTYTRADVRNGMGEDRETHLFGSCCLANSSRTTAPCFNALTSRNDNPRTSRQTDLNKEGSDYFGPFVDNNWDGLLQDDELGSPALSECNTDALVNSEPTFSARDQQTVPEDLPMHNKFINWSGVNHLESKRLKEWNKLFTQDQRNILDWERKRVCANNEAGAWSETRQREILKLRRERKEVMAKVNLCMNPTPLTVELAEARLHYGLGETDALLKMLSSGAKEELPSQAPPATKHQLIDRHRRSIEVSKLERDKPLQTYRRTRSLSPGSHPNSCSPETLPSSRPGPPKLDLQQLHHGEMGNTRLQSPSDAGDKHPVDIELLLREYGRAREEARTEIARARERLRERTEQEKRRLQQQTALGREAKKDNFNHRTRISSSTLCTGSSLSLSSGPTSGYNSANTTQRHSRAWLPAGQVSGLRDVEQKPQTRPPVCAPQDAKTQRAWLSAQDLHLEPSVGDFKPLMTSSPSPLQCARKRAASCSSSSHFAAAYQDITCRLLDQALAEVQNASAGDLGNLMRGKAAGGWRHEGEERAIQAFYKPSSSPSAHSFLGAGELDRSLDSLWKTIRQVSKSQIYNQSVRSVWTRPLDDSTQLVYILTDPSTCHLSQPRDFCCVSTESKQGGLCVLALQSVFDESLPRPGVDAVRGEMMPSCWLLQPIRRNGKEATRVVYLLQVDLGTPSFPPRLLGSLARKQAGVIADLNVLLA